MFQADNVAESLQCNSRKPEVTKLPVAVQIGGIENDMIMNMSVALRTKRKIFSYKIQKPLLKRNLKKDA